MTYFLPHDIARCNRDDCPLHLECARWLDRLPFEAYWYCHLRRFGTVGLNQNGCDDFIEKKSIEPKKKMRK